MSFSYDGKRQILDDISFKVNQGETIAFVGATGSGKSSIINVFMRFYEFQSGQVLLDGVDIRKYSKEALRKHIGLVLQEPFLYHGTIKSNIKMYQDISDETVQSAARFVDADQFIQKLPEKYDTKVTERGSSFSTGQRQLLAFARTVASQPKILILDEATANIDSETENIVQESLKKCAKGEQLSRLLTAYQPFKMRIAFMFWTKVRLLSQVITRNCSAKKAHTIACINYKLV